MIISGKHVAAGTNGGLLQLVGLAGRRSLLISFLGCILFTTFSIGFNTDVIRVFFVISLIG